MENNKVSTARVLIVDDMRVNRLILSSMLAAHNVESEMADSGAQCLELCRNNAYDLILLDQSLEVGDSVRLVCLDSDESLLEIQPLHDKSHAVEDVLSVGDEVALHLRDAHAVDVDGVAPEGDVGVVDVPDGVGDDEPNAFATLHPNPSSLSVASINCLVCRNVVPAGLVSGS